VNIASRNNINYTVDYLDGYQYESGKLLFFPTAEGYVKYTNGVSNPFDYVFNYTDHLGNIRLSYGINPETGMLTKIEENNYYPFGLKHATYNTEAKMIVKHQPIPGLETGSFGKYMVQKTDVLAEEMESTTLSTNSNPEFYSGYNYKFIGREQQDELGLNVTAMDYRQYDNALGRFMNPDRLAELAFDQTPYRYAYNNPIFFKDPSGLYEVDANGNIKITDTDEIKKFMGYLNHNQKATTNDMAEHIFNADNGYSYQLETVVITGRSEKAWEKGMSQARANQARAANAMSSFSGNVSIGNHEINEFDKGFVGADSSNMNSASAWAGYAGMHLTKTESLFKHTAQTSTGWANKASALKSAKYTAIAGKSLGVAGVGLTVYEDWKQNGEIGVGTGVKVAIGLATTFLGGPVVIGYAILDFTVGVATGTTLTDRIATGIENATKD
jgi:RHS repeat-associated protein